MAFVVKLLRAAATNTGGTTVIYSVSSPAVAAVVNNIRFVNTSGGNVTLNLYFNPSGSSVGQVRIFDRDKVLAAKAAIVVQPDLTMGQGDAIEASTTSAIHCVVCGVEKI